MESFMNSAQQIDELVMERQSWIVSSPEHRDRTMKTIARKMMAIEKSDPFMYNTVMSHLKSNIWTAEDFRKRMK